MIVCSAVISQDATYTIQAGMSEQGQISEDYFGTVYIASGSQLYALSQEGKQTFIFGKNRFGAITAIDATNPMKIAVCFGMKNIIYILDNKGNPIGTPIDLSASGISSTGDVCMAGDGSIWVFDKENLTVKQLNNSGTTVSQTTNLGRFIQIDYPDSVQIGWSKKNIFLTSGHNISLFSTEGTFVATYPISQGCIIANTGAFGVHYSCGDSVFRFSAADAQAQFVGKTQSKSPVYYSRDFYLDNCATKLENEATKKTSEKNILARWSYLSE